MRLIVILACCLVLAACGFHMRGPITLPFDTLYVPVNTPLAVELKRNIAASTQTKLVDTAEAAQARLQIQNESREKIILSLDSSGRVAEYQLRAGVAFRVVDNRGLEYLPTNRIQLTRDISFNDAEVLAKESEETLLYRDMQTDMVQQILRRLGAARTPNAAAPAPANPSPPVQVSPPPAASGAGL